MNRKIKTIDIAKKSGVSVTTVSRYFNHPELLSEKTIQKIEYAIRETDYSQDPLAKAMVTGNSDLVGVILPIAIQRITAYNHMNETNQCNRTGE